MCWGTPIFEELKLFDHGLRLIDVDPGYGWLNEDGETLMLFTDPVATARDIRRFSEADSRKYLELANTFQCITAIQGQLTARPLDEMGWRHCCRDPSLRRPQCA